MHPTTSILASAVAIGMLHGVEPGHGWPVAAAFALARRRPWAYGFMAALILAVAHLTSSFVVVAFYAVADSLFAVSEFRWMHIIAGGLLLLMAVHQWRTGGHRHGGQHPQHHQHAHDHDHHHKDPHRPNSGNHARRIPRPDARGLLGLVGFAFALGFVHEEEFAIIALAAGKASPWLVMSAYAAAVSFSLIALTMIAVAVLHRCEAILRPHQHKLPRISAVILAAMGLAYVLRLV